MRWGEATKLRPADLDLFRKRVSIPRNAVRTGDAIVVGTPKSHETRTVPLTADLVRLLAQQCDGKGRDDLLFPNRSGGYLRPSKWFRAAGRQANGPLTSPHQLRHVTAGLEVAGGPSVKSLQQMPDHSSAALTLDVYSGLSMATWTTLQTECLRRLPANAPARGFLAETGHLTEHGLAAREHNRADNALMR